MKPITQTKVTVNDQDVFRNALNPQTEIESIWDEFDDVATAPIQARSEKAVSSLLQILDEIQAESLRGNSFEREASK